MQKKERRLALRISAEAFLMFFVMTLLLLAALALFQDGSFAWFSRNVKNKVGGMQTTVDGVDITVSYYKENTDGEFVPFSMPEELLAGLMPGDSVRIRVDYQSHADRDVTLAVRLAPTEDGDTPLVLDGRYYYLATQLKHTETDAFLLAPPPDRIAYDAPAPITVTELGSVTVPAGGEASFYFGVSFVNYTDADQSAYQGHEGCYRQIISEIEN